MPIDPKQRLETVAKAEDTFNLLEHIAWTQVVKPALLKQRGELTTILVNAVLGGQIPAGPDGQTLSREQLAGMIYGIDTITKVFEKILREGDRAVQQLESQGFHLTAISAAVKSVV